MQNAALTSMVVAGLLTALAACSGPGQPQSEATSNPVLASRAALGDPMLALAESVIAVSDGLDKARHGVPRGQEAAAVVDDLPQRIEEMVAAVDAAGAAAERAPVPAAADIVAAAAEVAGEVVEPAERELAYLQEVTRIDTALSDAAAEWDRPGSQSEVRERLDALAGEVGALQPQVRSLRPVPAQCTVMKANRLAWTRTVVQRTRALQAQANSAGGTAYDELRSTYRSLPFAVEPRTADRADRSCWQRHSEVADAAERMREAVDALRAELSG